VLRSPTRGAVRRRASMAVVVCALGLSCVTSAAAALPDGRAYEMVSPPAKLGGDVMADASRTRAAVSGNAVNFTSLTAFPGVLGTGIAVEYISKREGRAGTNGWSTHGLFPQLQPLSALGAGANDTLYQGDFSDDLSIGVLRTLTPLTNDSDSARVANIYRRGDLLTAGSGSYELISACPGCASPLSDPIGTYKPAFVSATPDFSHIIFEAARNLTSDAPPQSGLCNALGVNCQPRLYEWDNGTVRLAGILPDGTPAPRSVGGRGASGRWYTPHTISDDGSRIVFTVAPNTNGSAGSIYLREDATTTVLVSESERTDCAGDPTCGGDDRPDPAIDPSGSQPETYETATADGSKVFFTTFEALTDDDGNGNADLYMYDASRPSSEPDNLVRVSAGSGGAPLVLGVLDATDDASHVYFAAQGDQLIAGEDPVIGEAGIYLWHEGDLSYVGSVEAIGSNLMTVSWNLQRRTSRITPDGRYLLFSSQSGAGLTGYDHGTGCSTSGGGPCVEFYLYDADAGSVACVSCNPSGVPATADATITIRTGTASGASSHINRALSDDGTRVFFETGESLTAGDLNRGKNDVYQYDVGTGALHLISSGTSGDDSHFLESSPDGRDVFFTTNEQLVGWDVDNAYDLYDARIGRGFPEPVKPVVECSGDACQGPVVAPPAVSKPRSSTFSGPDENVRGTRKAKARKCAKGKVRKRVHGKRKCVKRSRRRAHRRST
jgi:hypothetical protein